MQEDFHYYATYCAAYLAGYTHEESLDICYSAQFVDCCTRTLLKKIGGPVSAATTQLQLELANARTDRTGLQDITKIWASFHFLPRDLNADPPRKTSKAYRNKYRLICGPNGDLVKETVELAKGGSLQAVGIAMHVMADTWAHAYFAGTPSLVINNTGYYFYEIADVGGKETDIHLVFRHNPKEPDQPEKSLYTNSLFQTSENTIMNLGHGRAGHLPDYSFIKYRYLPAWGDYNEIIKDNPSDYMKAFTQMVYAMRCLRGDIAAFEKNCYDSEKTEPFSDEIRSILVKRQINACAEWKAFGEKLSGRSICDFDLEKYQKEYIDAQNKDDSFLGRFINAAIAQKSMVTNRIYNTGSKLAGISIALNKGGERA